MKVMLIAYHFDEYMLELFSALSKLDTYIVLILITNNPIPKGYEKNNLITIKKPRTRNVVKNVFILQRLRNEIKDFQPNVIHFQGCTFWFCLILRQYYKKIKFVHTIHDVCPHEGEGSLFKKCINHYFRKHSNLFIVHGEFLKKLLLEICPWIKQDSVYSIAHGPLSVYSKQNSDVYSEINNSVLFFGRLSKYKGLQYLIKAEPLISEFIEDFRIVIAGDGVDFVNFEKMMKDKSKFIILNRYIKNQEIPKIFQESSLVVLPYIEASQSGVIPLAYEFRKPVIATSVGSIPEVVDHGVTGFVIEPKNSKQIAENIIYLLQNPTLRKKMGENGFEKLQRDMNWNNIADKTKNVYLDSLK